MLTVTELANPSSLQIIPRQTSADKAYPAATLDSPAPAHDHATSSEPGTSAHHVQPVQVQPPASSQSKPARGDGPSLDPRVSVPSPWPDRTRSPAVHRRNRSWLVRHQSGFALPAPAAAAARSSRPNAGR